MEIETWQVNRVLFVTTSFPRFPEDYAGSFVFRFAKYLARDGMEICVLAPGSPAHPTSDMIANIQIKRISYFYPNHLQRLAYGVGIPGNLRLSWLARFQVIPFIIALVWAIYRHQKNYQVIHCHWLPTALAALLVRPFSRHNPPIILTNWGSDTRLLPGWLVKWTVKRIEGCISTAVETDEHLLAAGRTDFRRIMAPVDEERFVQADNNPDLRQELSLPEDVPILAFVGRLNYFKDPLTFIRAAGILAQNEMTFMALLAGDGDLRQECQQEIERLQLKESVILLGTRSDPERLFQIATLTAHISPVENTWANAIAEAMFMDVPVILTRVGYTERLFTHEQDCLLVPPENPRELAAAIMRLLENQELRDQIAQGARKLLRIQKKDSESIVFETRKYYDELVGEDNK